MFIAKAKIHLPEAYVILVYLACLGTGYVTTETLRVIFNKISSLLLSLIKY